ncbi:transcriptional regulator [Mycobacterium vicinigordonae]|uniref:Transcriptional regulator n=2 Tax=Mycobacterium vicinigordonae TaxID=1719132 RepID=A0A7D6E211_9MYCO|nr:transcriptional regulator [Mycobacterium vicinigordonae]
MPSSALRTMHERFVAGEVDASFLLSSSLRRVVAESWQRSLAKGVDPDLHGAPASAVSVDVARMRTAHPLCPALPVIRRLLVDDAVEAGVMVAIFGAEGTLLWVEGDRTACRQAEAMNFVPGADWSERAAGTNAPGTALALNTELQIGGSEHFSRIIQPWSCTAVPVHDPLSGAALGAVDVTGGPEVALPHTLALVRATVAAVENHLAVLRLTATSPVEDDAPRLVALGTDRARWQVVDEHGRRHSTTLTGRHADILALLSRHPEGLSADHLAVLLDENDLDVVTVRAEMSRLRKVIGADVIGSRPYRLLGEITSDLGDVFDALRAGNAAAALSHYRGPLLRQSVSPAIARLRTELSTSLRSAVMASKDVGLLRRWLELPDSRDDRRGWEALRDSANAPPAARAEATGHLAGLDFELA